MLSSSSKRFVKKKKKRCSKMKVWLKTPLYYLFKAKNQSAQSKSLSQPPCYQRLTWKYIHFSLKEQKKRNGNYKSWTEILFPRHQCEGIFPIVAVMMNHLATPKSTHCTVLTCDINNDNDYLQSINMFSYSITHIFSTGVATISNKLLKTKICSESLNFCY